MPVSISTIASVVGHLQRMLTSVIDQDINSSVKELGGFLHFLADIIDFSQIA